MKRAIILSLLLVIAASAQGQIKDPKATEVWEPVPKKITPGKVNSAPPSDAIVLFDGTNLNEWASRRDQGAAQWDVADGIFTVKPKTGDIISRRKFGDIQLHLGWKAKGKAGVTQASFYKSVMRFKSSTATRAVPTPTDRPVHCISSLSPW